MKIYTVKDKEGVIRPKVILDLPNVSESVQDGEIVEVDYGLEAVKEYVQKSKGEFELVICELTETNS